MSRSVDPLVVGHVIGDVIDMFVPSVDMAVIYTSREVRNGCQMKPSAASEAPDIQVSERNGDNNFFTLIMTDPDAPSPSEPSLREWVQWIVTDIPGQSSNSSSVNKSTAGQGSTKRAREPVLPGKETNERNKKGPAMRTTETERYTGYASSKEHDVIAKGTRREILPYVGPCPPIGIHRYIFVLYKQPAGPLIVSPPPVRNNFNTRNFAVENGLGYPVAATYFNAAKEPGSRRR